MVIAEFVRFLCFLFLVSKLRETIAVPLFLKKVTAERCYINVVSQ